MVRDQPIGPWRSRGFAVTVWDWGALVRGVGAVLLPFGTGVSGMISALAGGGAISIGGAWPGGTPIRGAGSSLTGLARSGALVAGDGGRSGSCLRCLTGAPVPVTFDDVTVTGGCAPVARSSRSRGRAAARSPGSISKGDPR